MLNFFGLLVVVWFVVDSCVMIGLIMLGVMFLFMVIGYLGLLCYIVSIIDGWGLLFFVLIFVLLVFYIILGMVMEGLGIIVMILFIMFLLIEVVGYSKLWFGIFMVIVIEMV